MSQKKTAYISFTAEIVPGTVENLLKTCADKVQEGYAVIHLLLSTPGGSVMHGIAAYNVLRGLPCDLTTHNVGNIDSIGAVIFLAGSRRLACSQSTFMFHGVHSKFAKDAELKRTSLQETMSQLDADENRIAQVVAARTKITLETVRGLQTGGQTFDPEWAKTNGVINDIAEVSIPQGSSVTQLVFQR